jgi:hypothetical protein
LPAPCILLKRRATDTAIAQPWPSSPAGGGGGIGGSGGTASVGAASAGGGAIGGGSWVGPVDGGGAGWSDAGISDAGMSAAGTATSEGGASGSTSGPLLPQAASAAHSAVARSRREVGFIGRV